MIKGIYAIVEKEWIQIKRDKVTLLIILFMPILQLLVTGLAIQKDVKHLPTVVVDKSNTMESRQLISSLRNSQYFDPNYNRTSMKDAHYLITAGKAQVAVYIPDDYKNKINKGETSEIKMLVDGANAGVARLAMSMAQLVVKDQATKILQNKLNQYRNAGDDFAVKIDQPLALQTQVLYNPELKHAFFVVPGLLGTILQMLTMLFTSFAIVRERERGTLEQLMVSPINSKELMIGKMIPYTLIGFFDLILSLFVMIWFFNIPVSGQLSVLIITSTIFLISCLSIGMLISTLAKTQVQAIQMTFAIIVPTLLLTGFVFPLDPMPVFVKVFSYCLPLTYYLDIIRGIVLKGAGFVELWPQTLSLVVFAIVLMLVSILRFRKKIA